MLLEALDTDVLTALEELVPHLNITVDVDFQARVFRLREALLARSMEPLRAFDELKLYQLSKADSTRQFRRSRSARLVGGDREHPRSISLLARPVGCRWMRQWRAHE